MLSLVSALADELLTQSCGIFTPCFNTATCQWIHESVHCQLHPAVLIWGPVYRLWSAIYAEKDSSPYCFLFCEPAAWPREISDVSFHYVLILLSRVFSGWLLMNKQVTSNSFRRWKEEVSSSSRACTVAPFYFFIMAFGSNLELWFHKQTMLIRERALWKMCPLSLYPLSRTSDYMTQDEPLQEQFWKKYKRTLSPPKALTTSNLWWASTLFFFFFNVWT